MNTRQILLLIFICFSLMGSSCCNKDEAPIVYIPLDTTFLSYCAFPVGSWWVYEEQNTGQRDSFYVAYYYTETMKNSDENLNYYELGYRITTLIDTFNFGARPWGDESGYRHKFTEYYNVNNGTLSADRFFYPISITDTVNYNLFLKNVLDTITINSILYTNIYVMANKSSVYNNKIKTEYYCKNVGVIKRELFNGEIWEIENYYIKN
jgi:hypothetical protein